MGDNFLEELFDSSFKDTKEPFTTIFKIENTDLGLQLIALTPIKIDEISLDFGKRIISDNPLINGVPIFDLQDKYLVGKTHIDSNVFHITGWEDSPPKD
jgi:hypothetical protein